MDEQYPFLGALVDTRSEEEKKGDYGFVELTTSAAPVNWQEKPESKWRKFLDQNQNGSGSCVAQTIRKLAQILFWLKTGIMVNFSATWIYQFRSNKPGGGMIGVEAFEIWRNKGVGLEQFTPSELMSDAQMDATKIEPYMIEVAKVFALSNHIGGVNGDFEAVASIIQQTGKGVMVWFYFNGAEWSPKIPVILDPSLNLYADSTSRHSVAAVDFTLVNGKKYLIIEDSALFGGITRRLISEEFFKARNWFVRYPMQFKFDDQTQVNPNKPKHIFTQTLSFIALDKNGNISNPFLNKQQEADVKKLQDILRYEGVFPANVSSTGYFGAITLKSVKTFQAKHGLVADGLVGKLTIGVLNQLYGA